MRVVAAQAEMGSFCQKRLFHCIGLVVNLGAKGAFGLSVSHQVAFLG